MKPSNPTHSKIPNKLRDAINFNNIDTIAKLLGHYKKEGLIKQTTVDLGEGPASDYGTGKQAND